MTDWLEVANERTDWRTENGKNYELDPKAGVGQYGLEARTGPIHFQEDGKSGPWLDIDTEYFEDKGTYLWYPKMHNKIKVFKDRLGYEIISPSGHLCRIELVSVGGSSMLELPTATKMAAEIKIHPFKIGISPKATIALANNVNVRWKITEIGTGEKDRYPFTFKPQREAYSVDSFTSLAPDQKDSAHLSVQSALTRIDDTSMFLDEIWPKGAKLINPNTDFVVAAGANDGRYCPDYLGSPFWDNSNVLSVGYYSAGGTSYWSHYFRLALSIPKDSTINSAAFAEVNAELYGTGNRVTRVYTETSDNPGAITSYADAAGRTLSAGYVDWTFTVGSVEDTKTSPSVSDLLQTHISSAGWASGQYVQFHHKNQNCALGDLSSFYSYDGSASKCPKVSATWTEPSTGMRQTYPRGIGRGLFRGMA